MPPRIEIPASSLSSDAVEGLVEEFVTREGTDYGEREYSLVDKRDHVLRQLQRGEIGIVFDVESESTTLVTREELVAIRAQE